MKSIKCLVLLGLLVASVSAAPGLIDSILDTVQLPFSGSVAESAAESQAHSLGGNFGLGPFSIGGNLDSASSKAHSSASAVNSAGYEQRVPIYSPEHEPTYGQKVSESHAASSAQSEAHSLGGGVGFGPFKIGANLNSAHSSASSLNYDRAPRLHRPEYARRVRQIELGQPRKLTPKLSK